MMQLAGNGIIRPGILSCNIGTASRWLCPGQTHTRHRIQDQYLLPCRQRTVGDTGFLLTGGVALKWLRDNILHMSDFEEMSDLAGTAPAGSDGLLFLPYLSGERCPYNDPNARGIYFGMSLYHSREHLIRSTMEGVIFG